MKNNFDHLSGTILEKLARFFWVFSDPSRLKIIVFLLNTGQEACCVNKIAASLGMNQPAVSQHLRALKDAHLVKVVREKQFYRYSIADAHVKDVLTVGLQHLWEETGGRE
ncbi:MAG: helix-turn-helix transcriptional regulator [Calditrichaeota bacterium]|nr:helix-turn-helix transcriptional regulator [Calditrichota bacterium]